MIGLLTKIKQLRDQGVAARKQRAETNRPKIVNAVKTFGNAVKQTAENRVEKAVQIAKKVPAPIFTSTLAQVPRGIVQSGIRIANEGQKVLEKKPEVPTFTPTTPFQKLVAGREPIKGFQQGGNQLGIKNPKAAYLVGGLLAGADFTPIGGEDAFKAIAKSKNLSHIAGLLKNLKVADEEIPALARTLRNVNQVDEVKKAISGLSQNLHPLHQEALKYKSAEEFVKARETAPVEPTYTEAKLPMSKIKAIGTKESFQPDSLAYSKSRLKAGKSLKPIEVVKEGDHYVISDGEHRFQAYQESGYKGEIPVKIEGEPLTKSQLTSIYNEAHAKSEVKTPEIKTPAEPLAQSPLHQEALKYKSAEEFVTGYGDRIAPTDVAKTTNYLKENGYKVNPDGTVIGYHASPATDKILAENRLSTGYFAPTKAEASSFAKGKVIEMRIDPESIAINGNGFPSARFESFAKGEDGVWRSRPEAIRELRAKGQEVTPEDFYKQATKSQLTDIYNQANSVGSERQGLSQPLQSLNSPEGTSGLSPVPEKLPRKTPPPLVGGGKSPQLPVVTSSSSIDISQHFDVGKYVTEHTKAQRVAENGAPIGLLTKGKSLIAHIKTKLVDFSAPIEDVLNATTKKAGIKLSPKEDIHNQIDRVLRAPTIAGQFAKDSGLIDVIRGVDNPDALNQYLIAKHAPILEARGISTGRDLTKDKLLVDRLAPGYEKYAQAVYKYSHGLLDYAVQSGLVNKDLAASLKVQYPNYVPFNRIFSEAEEQVSNFGTKAIASLSKQTAVQKIKGSSREIANPLESILAKTNDVFRQGEKNIAGRLLAGYEKLPGNPFQLKELSQGERAMHTISFLDNGVKRTFSTTPEIAQAAKALGVEQLSILGRILAIPTRIARVGITGINLPFVGANLAKDQVTAFINSDYALRGSVANPVLFTQSLFNAVGHGELYQEMVRAGGSGTSFDISREQVKQTVSRIRAGRNLGSKILYTAAHPSELLRAVEDIIGRSEELTRLQQYAGTKQGLLAKGMDVENAIVGAARGARENTVNFARRGEWGTVLNSVFLYLNAGIQGTRTLLTNLKNKPVQTSAKIAMTALFPMAAVTAWNLNDPKRKAAYDDIADYEKQNNIIIVPPNPVKDERGKWNVIKVPLSQEINNLVGISRRLVEQAYGENPIKFADFANALVGTVSPINPTKGSIMSTLTPQIAKPFLEGTLNKNLFTGRQQVPDSMKFNPPNLQVQPYTSGTARLLAKPLNISPIKMEEGIKTTFGGVGSQVLNASDQILAKLGAIPADQIGGQNLGSAITGRFNKAQGGVTENKVKYGAVDAAALEVGKVPLDDPNRTQKLQDIFAALTPDQRKSLNFSLLKAGVKTTGVFLSDTGIKFAQVQKLLAEGKTDEAAAITKAMTKEEYSKYKSLKTSAKTKAAEEAMLPLYQHIQELISQEKTEEAAQITRTMSKTDYRIYKLLKNKYQ